MATVTWKGQALALAPDETVLEGLLRHGIAVAASCRVGVCQSCLLRAARGPIPDAAQKGLGATLRARGYFLACRWRPDGASDLVEIADQATLPSIAAVVRTLDRPGADVLRLGLETEAPFAYRAGQFVSLARADGLTRSYSLASLPAIEAQATWLEIHVKRLHGGQMSNYLHDGVRVGDRLTVRGPGGDCFYTEGRPRDPLLLAGTGTGLAPLLGIARDALARGHLGPIRLIHGALTAAGLYADAELRALARAHPTFRYEPCVLQPSSPCPCPCPSPAPTGEFRAGEGDAIPVRALPDQVLDALREHPGVRAFLCGPPELVVGLRRRVFLAGVPLADILADAFITAAPPAPPMQEPRCG
jgi:ferredoxin-NADP reductase/ferredoxin